MSVDLTASVRRPVSLAAVVGGARSTMCELLGLDSAPGIEVAADPHFEQGLRVGRSMSDAGLVLELIGGRTSAEHFDFRVANRGDLAWLNIFDVEGEVEAVFSPVRTCVGVVVGTALSLAVAKHGGGDFIDDQIRMLDPGETNPALFIQRTRLTGAEADFDSQCERFMRQFARLGGWPRDVSLASTR